MKFALLALAVGLLASASAVNFDLDEADVEVVSMTGGEVVEESEPIIVDEEGEGEEVEPAEPAPSTPEGPTDEFESDDLPSVSTPEPSPAAVAKAHAKLDELQEAALGSEAPAATGASAEVDQLLGHNKELLAHLEEMQVQRKSEIQDTAARLKELKHSFLSGQQDQLSLLHANHVLTLKSNVLRLQAKKDELQSKAQSHRDALQHIESQMEQLEEARQQHSAELEQLQSHITTIDAALAKSHMMLDKLSSAPVGSAATASAEAIEQLTSEADQVAGATGGAVEEEEEEESEAPEAEENDAAHGMLRGMKERLDSLREKLQHALSKAQEEPQPVEADTEAPAADMAADQPVEQPADAAEDPNAVTADAEAQAELDDMSNEADEVI